MRGPQTTFPSSKNPYSQTYYLHLRSGFHLHTLLPGDPHLHCQDLEAPRESLMGRSQSDAMAPVRTQREGWSWK